MNHVDVENREAMTCKVNLVEGSNPEQLVDPSVNPISVLDSPQANSEIVPSATAVPTARNNTRVPLRWSLITKVMILIAITPLLIGLYVKYVKDRPLQDHQRALVTIPPLLTSTFTTTGQVEQSAQKHRVAVARTAISPGDRFLSTNVQLIEVTSALPQYAVVNDQALWGRASDSCIGANQVIDARVTREEPRNFMSFYGSDYYLISNQDINPGDSLTAKTNRIPAKDLQLKDAWLCHVGINYQVLPVSKVHIPRGVLIKVSDVKNTETH